MVKGYLKKVKLKAEELSKREATRSALNLQTKQNIREVLILSREFGFLINDTRFANVKKLLEGMRDDLRHQRNYEKMEFIESETLRVQANLLDMLLEMPEDYRKAALEAKKGTEYDESGEEE